jgi:hypothetical protein
LAQDLLVRIIVVIPLRARLSSIAIVAAMLVAAAAPLLANGSPHGACPTNHDDCSKTTQWKACCFEQGDRSNDATPAPAKTEIAQPIAATVAVARASYAIAGVLRHACVVTTVARSSPPDLITLFGTFLI